MEQILKLFKHDLKTQHLELRLLKPTKENAAAFWNIIKDENPDDFKYISFTPNYMTEKHLPTSEIETFETLIKQDKEQNAVNWATYHNNELIGFFQIRYWHNNSTLEMAEMWFIKSAQGQGFSKEINQAIEKIAFSIPSISRIGWQCFEQNTKSKKAALSNGYTLLSSKPDSIHQNLVRMVFIKNFPAR